MESFEELPTIGKKTAQRLAHYVVTHNAELGLKIAHGIEDCVCNLQQCKMCGNIAELDYCNICLDNERDTTLLCIVMEIKDILTIEQNGDYSGLYFILSQYSKNTQKKLSQRLDLGVKEVIFAFPPSLANNMLIAAIEEDFKNSVVSFSKIAQGVPTGINLENVDAFSLSNAIKNRVET